MADMAKEIVKLNGFSDGELNFSPSHKLCDTFSAVFTYYLIIESVCFLSYNCYQGKGRRD